MKLRTIDGVVPLLVCACLAGATDRPASQARPGVPATESVGKKETGGIRGCVMAADTSGPLRKATVQAIATAIGVVRSTPTDAMGCYAFTDLPAGRYAVRASKPPYLPLDFGEDPVSGREGELVTVSDAKVAQGVDFRLPKGGVIAGRVVDETGEPVANVPVQVMVVVSVGTDEQPTVFPLALSARSTNDLGRYRVFGVPPGEYYVCASARAPANKATPELSGFVPTYFPRSTDLHEAAIVSVRAGQEIQNIDIVLAPAASLRKFPGGASR